MQIYIRAYKAIFGTRLSPLFGRVDRESCIYRAALSNAAAIPASGCVFPAALTTRD